MNALDWLNPWAQPPQDPRMLPSPGASVFRNDNAGPTQQYKGDQLPFTPRPQAIPGQPMYESGLQPPSNYGPQDPPVASMLTDGLSAEESNAMVAGQEDPNVQVSPVSQNAGDPTDIMPDNMDANTQDPENAPVESYNSDKKDSLNLSSPSWGKFMSNPGASDALLAFGANMLSAKSFNEGLGKGGAAFGAALKPYEPMSDAEKERLTYAASLKAKVAQAGKGGSVGKWIKADSYVDDDGKLHSVFKNNVTGEVDDRLTGGSRPQDSARGAEQRKAGTLGAATREADFELINQAPGRIAVYDSALSKIDSGGVGSDWLTQAKRKIALGTGFDMFGINIRDASELDTYMSQIELDAAKAVKGQGQVTEFERKIIQASKGKITSDPEALKNILGILKKSEVRRQQMGKAYDKWDSDPRNGSKSYFDFKRDWATGKIEGFENNNYITGGISAEAVQPDGSTIPAATQQALDKYKPQNGQ